MRGEDNFLKDKEVVVTVIPYLDLYQVLECFEHIKISQLQVHEDHFLKPCPMLQGS